MKKISYEDKCGPEPWQTLYIEIEELYGGWMSTTAGNPITLHDCEETMEWYEEGDEEYKETADFIEFVENIEKSGYEIEECDKHDIEYVEEWLRIWGVIE